MLMYGKIVLAIKEVRVGNGLPGVEGDVRE